MNQHFATHGASPDLKITRLANGLTVITVPRTNLPLVSASLVSLGGSTADPEGKAAPRVVLCSSLLVNFVVALRHQPLFIRHLHVLVQAFPISLLVVCDVFGIDVVVYL